MSTYSFKNMAVNVGGIPMKGKGKINIEPMNPRNVSSSDGNGRFITTEHVAHKHVRAIITLDQTATENLAMSAFYEANQVLTIGVKDLQGQSAFVGAEFVFEQRPTGAYEKESVTDRDWTLFGSYTAWIEGGNA